MATHTYISLFSGAGMLDAAIRCALPDACCVCFVEREAPAAAILAARMRDGALHEAPIWSDITAFDGRPFNGRVDGIIGGFPCTDLSVAGRQAGLDGDASGLFFEYVRIIREVQPRWVFIENVPPVLSFPAGGTVLGELAELGFDAEWGTVRASDVGAPHRRDRAFILAYDRRTGNERRGELGDIRGATIKEQGEERQWERHGDTTGDVFEHLAYAPQRGLGIVREPSGRGGFADGCDAGMADTSNGQLSMPGRGPEARDAAGSAGAVCEFCGYPIDPAAGRYGCANCEGDGLADAEERGQQERGGRSGHDAPIAGSERDSLPLFPPGPADAAAWQRILSERPDLAPAIESGVRGLADGVNTGMDESQTY